MRTLLFALLFISAPALAFDEPFLRLHLNQRNYMNPGSICPFCSGSCFLTYGMRYQHNGGTNPFVSQYLAFGNDARNQVHGPWDVMYMNYSSPVNKVNMYSARYAFAIDLNDWRLSIGVRGAYYYIREQQPDVLVAHPGTQEQVVLAGAKGRGKLFDADAGVMLSDLHGSYAGVSFRHPGAPSFGISNEGGTVLHRVQLKSAVHAMAGTKIPVGNKFDICPEASFQYQDHKGVFDGGAMFRYKYRWTVGTYWGNVPGSPALSFRAGYTHPKFKWITSVEPSSANFSIETGIVWRFHFNEECTGGACRPPQEKIKKKKKVNIRSEFFPRN